MPFMPRWRLTKLSVEAAIERRMAAKPIVAIARKSRRSRSVGSPINSASRPPAIAPPIHPTGTGSP